MEQFLLVGPSVRHPLSVQFFLRGLSHKPVAHNSFKALRLGLQRPSEIRPQRRGSADGCQTKYCEYFHYALKNKDLAWTV